VSLIAAQLSPPAVMCVRCHYCSKFRSPREVLYIGTGGACMCWDCYDWHNRALDALAGTPPPGCQECGVTYEQLRERAGGGDCGMYVHPRDGMYQVLCKKCSDAYVPQRVDLYRPTQYGHNRKL
jgi:hypothetical protein